MRLLAKGLQQLMWHLHTYFPSLCHCYPFLQQTQRCKFIGIVNVLEASLFTCK